MAGYTRNDTSNNIATGNVINAADLDGEFDALVAAFHASTGHTHDGTAANGAPITKIGPAQDLVISTGAITPKTDNTVDLGSSSFEFKDLYIDGTANIDALVADTADINAGTIDGTAIGANSASTGAFTTLSASSTVTLSGGTANGVLYLNGSKVATSGSALTFDGSTFSVAGEVRANATFRSSDGTNIGIFGSNVLASGVIGVTSSNNIPLAFGVAATEQMRLTSTGLGIGTSSPSYKLDVAGADLRLNTPSGTAAFRLARAGTNKWAIYNDTSENLHFYSDAAGLDRAILDSSGNLGLGVTPSAWGGGWTALQVGRSALFTRPANDGTHLGWNLYVDGTDARYIASAASTQYRQYLGEHAWFTAPSGTAGNAISFTQAMTLDASGNLVVGGTSALLSAAGRGNITINGSSTAILNFGIGGTGSGYIYHYGTGMEIVNQTNTPLTFSTNNTERARITSGGDFYINTTAAGGKFYVVSDLAANNGIRVDVPASFTASSIALVSATAAGTGWFFLTGESSGGSSRIQIRGDGNLYNANGTYGTISDARLKQDIVNAPSQWDDLKAVRFRKYRMKEDVAVDPNAPALLGVVAQELEQVCPGLVDEHTNTNGETIKTVKSSVLLMKAAVALQEAMARIETLEAKVSALEGN